MKGYLLSLTIAVSMCLALLAGCGVSEFGIMVDDNGGSCVITAENADDGDRSTAGSLIVEEGDQLLIEPDFEGEARVQVQLAPANEEAAEDIEADPEDVLSEEPVLDETIGGTEARTFDLAPGEYMVTAAAEKGLTGTATLTVQKAED